MFSRAWHRLHVFPRLAPVACFPALGTGCMFSRTWRWLNVFPRLVLVIYLPALGASCMFLGSDWFIASFALVCQMWLLSLVSQQLLVLSGNPEGL